jgi:hypothetical protein
MADTDALIDYVRSAVKSDPKLLEPYLNGELSLIQHCLRLQKSVAILLDNRIIDLEAGYTDQAIPYPRGYISGLEISNNLADATNDIDIAAGVCRDSTDTVNIIRSAAITKRLDAAWAVGDGNGGLDTGSIANTTYHVHVIRRSDTGVVDALFSTSAVSPTLPANYDDFRRVGSIIRTGGAIKAFTQRGDHFMWTSLALDHNTAAAFAFALKTITVPTGIVVSPSNLIVFVQNGAGTVDASVWDVGGAVQGLVVKTNTAGQEGEGVSSPFTIFTDDAAQVNLSIQLSGATLTSFSLYTQGWVDVR